MWKLVTTEGGQQTQSHKAEANKLVAVTPKQRGLEVERLF